MSNPSTTAASMVPITPSLPTPTLKERLAVFGIPNVTNVPFETAGIIVTLLTKLETQNSLLIMIFARSNLERFFKKVVISYMPAKWKKKRTAYHAGYVAFYEDSDKNSTFSTAVSQVRKLFPSGAKHFADVCTSFYERASKLTHNLAEVCNSAYSAADLLQLLTHIPKLDENEHRALHAITSLSEMS